MRVVFMGTPDFALPSLRALLESHYEVSAIFTQPDRPAGRGHRPQPPPTKTFAETHAIPVYQPAKIRSEENRALIEGLNPDFLVVVAYGQILPSWLLQIPRIAPVNVHGSLLPRYRGAAPAASAILNGDRVTGVTTMLMDARMDAGPMLLQREVPIPENMNRGELEQVLADIGAELLIPTLEGFASNVLTPIPQDESQATLAPKITREMGRISWQRMVATTVHNLVRALSPSPAASTDFRGQTLNILRTSLPATTPSTEMRGPGTFLDYTERGVLVQCGGGTVVDLQEVQLAGRKRITGRDFVNGTRVAPGELLFHSDKDRSA